MKPKKLEDIKEIASMEDLYNFLNLINQKNEKIIFRGQADEEWKVKSSLFRKLDVNLEIFFKLASDRVKMIKESFPNMSELEIYAQLQHHGGLTPLIDFTSNYFNSLWFACSDVSKSNKQGVLYWKTLKGVNISKNIDFNFFKEQVYESPIDIKRGIAQKSFFVLDDCNGLDNMNKIIIKKDAKFSILNFLRKKDISAKTIFPDIHGLSKEWESISPMNFLHKGRLLDNEGKYDQAIIQYDQAIKLEKKYITAYIFKAQSLMSKKEFGAAINELNTVIILNPKHVMGYINRAICFVHKGDGNAAYIDYEAAFMLEPENKEVLQMKNKFGW